MERKLTSQQRERLLKSHRKERDKRVCDRIKAVLAYDDGYSYSEIARILLLDDETIRRHIEDYFSKRKLRPENGGSESQLTASDAEQLVAHLEEMTYLYVKDICLYTQKTFGVYYTISGMTKWLHQNHFRYKKPHAVPAKADKARQEKFIKMYRKLKKKAADNEPIYFVDSVHPQHQTQLAYGWILKGKRKSIPTTARQRRLNIIGGICLSGHKIVHHSCDKVNAISINAFLKSLSIISSTASAFLKGSDTVNSLPRVLPAGGLFTIISPFINLISSFVSASPTPVPSDLRVRLLSD